MVVTDKVGREITKGSYIIYTSIGTIGEVIDIKTDEHGSWVLISIDELTKLWYNTNYVELTDEKYMKRRNNDSDKEKSVEDIKEEINGVISSEMSDDGVGGG
ncbi:DUF2098 family protein [Methanosphaera sp. WGK6]|uniref:DUF2098 family protein n=1 Tax=Methanosphaera sp. WGK6 TaxID=1561964 RepID=UPI00084C11C4|nr:DUF2098 family protein [Methanosphaera sp. WGK6]OED30878.1 hypothetical protein NL43_00780 [Methanosphaera sp. WGK6]